MNDNNVYISAYFRIRTKGYDFNEGMGSYDREAFFSDCRKVLGETGFGFGTLGGSGSCPDGFRGIENLYCHPQEISGYVRKDKVEEIEQVLRTATVFQNYHTDLYEEALNYTPEEFQVELKNRKPQIIEDILKLCTTKRENLFITGSLCGSIHTGIKIFRHSKLEGIQMGYVADLFEELVTEGKLQKAKTKVGVGYRSTKK